MFLRRPNRFIAWILMDGEEVKCHVKNTGRLGELLLPGAEILVEPAKDPGRKTAFSLIFVKKDGQWVNIDSQAPNRLAWEWIETGGFLEAVTRMQREKTWGHSRFDLYLETEKERWYMEVKGVTLNVNGTALFPDAPTERGLKHVEELIACQEEGYRAAILFVIQMKGVQQFQPFKERQPAFAEALRRAKEAGVCILAMDCQTKEEEITIDAPVPVVL